MSFASGKDGAVLVGSTPYAFGKWDLDINTKAVPTNNFTSQGFNDNVAGFTGGTITLQGPWDIGSMPLTSGTVYTFNLNNGITTIPVPARVTNIKPSNDAEGTPTVSVTAVSKGVFTPSIT
jgi:hypothetical protein